MKLADNNTSLGNPQQERETGARMSLPTIGTEAKTSSTISSGSIFRASTASELQDLDIWRIVACLPHAGFADIKQKILGLSRDHSFAMNYWVKVCKLRAMKGLPMPWETIH
ncbi:MAG: hypothetical protein RQ757_02085 [Pseudomonadales bacterium]|nr:hypothetical protein [Pseudomonadales bacterium]